MKFIKNNWGRLSLILSASLIPIVSWADTQGPVTNPCVATAGKICNPLGTTSTIPALIHNILIGALTLGIPVVALAIVYSGFLFVFARGNSEKLGKAKDTLMYTLIGAA